MVVIVFGCLVMGICILFFLLRVVIFFLLGLLFFCFLGVGEIELLEVITW